MSHFTPLSQAQNWNFVDNPSFDVAQALTTVTLPSATDTHTLDRWKARKAGGATQCTVSQQTGFSGAQFCLRTQRIAAVTATNQSITGCQFENAVALSLAGKWVTWSFDIRTGANNTLTDLTWSTATGTGTNETMGLSSGFATGHVGWAETITLTAGMSARRIILPPAPIDANVTQMGLQVLSSLYVGTAGAADYFEITNVKMELGPAATPFVRYPLGVLFAPCLRRYRKSFPQATAPAASAGLTGAVSFPATVAGAAVNQLGRVDFGAPMALTLAGAVPTITTFNPSAAGAQARNVTDGADCTSTTVANNTDSGFSVIATGTAGTAVGEHLAYHWTADSRI